MKRSLNNLCRKEKGLSVIELLITIMVIAVLIAIAIPNYLSMKDRIREAATEAEMSNIATALELYNADNGKYPGNDDKWSIDLKDGGYMSEIPLKDKWNNDYTYIAGPDQKTYVLISNGKDKNTTDDDIVWANNKQTSTGAYQ
ncbi:MAG: type II secretion system protein GspG [Actinomycetota bacterium]|nr:type II secretion system protein GspG [Actinomycetota bacterium]